MATNGRIKTDYVNGGYTFAVDWTLASQDVASNTSQLTAVVKLISNGSSYTINSTATKNLTLNINGKAYTTTVSASLTGNQTKTLFTKTVTIPHNADGTKTVAISATLAIAVTLSGTYYATFTASGNASLTTIPRQSEITSVTETVSVDGTNALAVSIKRKSSAFTHTVRIKFGAKEQYFYNAGTSVSYVVPTDWLEAIPNSTSGTGTVFVTTLDASGNKIGSTVSKGYKLTVPASVKPTFTSLDVARVNGDVPSDWGIYVQGKSKCKATITGASGIYGSTITKYDVSIGDFVSSESTLEADLPTAGTVTIKGTVTDSRGRTFSRTATITVQAYKVPVFDSITLYRASQDGTENPEGTYIGGKIAFTYSQIGNNTINTSVEYRVSGATEWTYAGSFANGQAFTFADGNISVDSSYDVRLGLSDALGWLGKIESLATGFTTLDFLKGGKGIGFGKAAETANLADFAFNARFRNGFQLDGGITPDHMTRLECDTGASGTGQYIRLLYFPYKMANYNSYNITLHFAETIYGAINGLLDFHLRAIVNRFDVKKLNTRALAGGTASSDFYADFDNGICSIWWKPITEYARLRMGILDWNAYENAEIDPANLYVLDGSTVQSAIGSDYIRVTHTTATAANIAALETSLEETNNTVANVSTTANSALETANSANEAAKSATTTANSASETANSASSTASNALDVANAASTNADTAKSDAATAKTDASAAKTTANTANTTANAAKTTANAASTVASNAQSTADTAKANAATAQSAANKAATAASNAQTAADTAKTTADNAASVASTASSTAQKAMDAVSSATNVTALTNSEIDEIFG